jgi:hypothetical protein
MAGEGCESLAGTLGEPSGSGASGMPSKAAQGDVAVWADSDDHAEVIGVDWGTLAPAFSPVLLPKRLFFFFDATFFSFPTGRTSADESPATSVFYTRRLVNGYQSRAHMD